MAQKSCSYTFRGPDGENVVLRGMAAIKAFLASGGLEYLRAPEARQSRARDVTETPAFKKWFGDSKVVDAEGKPLVVYHGTPEAFTAFDPAKSSESLYGAGFYFAESEDRAREWGARKIQPTPRKAGEYIDPYADMAAREASAKVMPVYLSISNPADAADARAAVRQAKKDLGDQILTPEVALRAQQILVAAGHDGVEIDGYEFVAFRPEQIKSAIGNNGQFDPTNPDIRKSEERSGSIIYGGQGGLPASKRPTAEQIERGYAAQRSVVAGMDRAYRQEVKKFLAQNPNPRAPGDDGIDAALNTYIHKDGDRLAVLQARNSQPTRPRTLAYVNGDSVQWLYSPSFLPPGINTETALAAAKKGAGAYLLDGENFESSLRNIRKSEERYVDTDNFKRWFGDSVMTNSGKAGGKPMVLYHGGFDFVAAPGGKAIPRVSSRGALGVGFYMTPDENMAAEYEMSFEEGSGSKGAINELYARVQKPLVIKRDEPGVDAAVEALVLLGMPRDKAQKKANAAYDKYGYVGSEIKNLAQDQGYDGLTHYYQGKLHEVVVWTPVQVKSATNNNGDFSWNPDIRKSAERPWYSQLERAIEGVPARLDNQSAVQWAQWLKANAAKMGVKQDEVTWSGIEDWLKLKGKEKVSKAEIGAFLGANGVRVEEVALGDQETAAKRLRAEEVYAEGDQWTVVFNDGTAVGISQEIAENEQRAEEEARILLEEEGTGVAPALAAKYGQYTLPGGTNYRELLLTLPERRTLTKAWRGAQEAYGDDDQRTIDAKRAAKAEAGPQQGYKSSHWDQRNVLAHIRLNDRTDADGKRVLFVEELQSDWGADARKKGIKQPGARSPFEVRGELQKVRDELGQRTDRDFRDEAWAKHPDLKARHDALLAEERGAAGSVPAAPFIDDTSKWLNLALKRVISLATSEGYDSVAFVTGEQSAERYDLSKQVSRVAIIQSLNIKTGKPVNDGMLIAYDLSGKETISKYLKSESDIEELVGKEVAARLIAAKPVDTKEIVGTTRRRELKGLDLSVGGEGMKAFYDQIAPQAASALVKKMGGEGMTTIRVGQGKPDKKADLLGFDESEFQIRRSSFGWVIERGQQFMRAGDGKYWGGSDWTADEGQTRVFATKEEAEASATASPQPGFTITPAMREKAAGGMPLFSRERATNTPEFKRWFGDSKVTVSGRSGGVPRVVYHGTNTSFSEFQLFSNSAIADGFYFTSSAYEAEDYGDTLMPVYLALRNPAPKKVWGPMARAVERGEVDSAEVRERLEGMGYDGLHGDDDIASEPETKIYVAFYPEQIKSAIGNNGQFDPTNPDITKSRERGLVEDIPNEGWLQGKIDYAEQKGRNRWGVPHMSTITGRFKEPVQVSVRVLAKLRGQRDEQNNKRGDSLEYIRKNWDEVSRQPPYVEVAYNGEAWVSEGNHRIMVAAEKGIESLPVEIRYFDGGQRRNGPLAPGRIASLDPSNAVSSRERAETPEFKRWFKDSKVADESGRPAVVYHGTAQEKDRFRREGGGAGPGVWFSTSPKLASTYAQMDTEVGDGGGPAVMPVYLSIKNPIILTGMESYAFDWEQRSEWEGLGHDGAHNPEAGEWIAFEPTQIKSAIGNDGSFDDNDPNILSSAARAWESPGASKFDDIVYKMQDKQVDLKRIVEAVKDAKGELANDRDAYLREELFHGRAAKRTEDFVSKELQPLVDEMAKRGLTIEDLDQYLHARHAPEANRLIAERNPDSPLLQDGGSGLDTVLAQQYMADLGADKKAHLEAAAAKVDAILAQTRRLVVDYELESKDTVDGWGEMFDHYVPLMREDDGASVGGLGTGQGFSVKGRETKSRTGSTKKVVDILANIAMQRERTIVRGEKNRVAQSLVALAKENPNKDFWTVDLTPTTPTFDPKKGVVVQRPDPMFKARPNVVVAKIREEDGSVKEHAVIFSEKDERALRMATAMKNLDNTALDGLMGSAAKITRYFSAIVTSYNPVFGGVNYIRDFQAVMINLKSTPLDGMQKQVAVDSMKAMKAIYQNVRTGATTTEWQKLWEEFQDVGGQTGFRQLFANSQDRADSINAAINPDYWMDSKFGKVFTANGVLKMPISQASKIVKAGFKWLQDYNDALENATRLAVYKAGLDKGLTKEEAASIAKNISANFNRKGQMGQQVGALYAFANASAQGSARLGQLLFDMEPGKPKTIRLSRVGKRIVSGGVLLGVAQALALMAAGFDDEDPPAFVRERSLVIPTGGKGYISIPMPLGLHVLPNFGRVTTEWAMGGFKKTPQRAIGFAGLLAEAFVPTGSSGLSMQTIAPTMLDPLVALSENKDWQGRPIAKESRNPATPGHSLMKDSATTWSRQLAEMINYATGGNEYVAGALSPTPDQLDYVASALGGGVAKEISKLEQTARGLITGEEVPTFKIPLVGRFVGSAASQASEGGAFYASSSKLNELETEIKGLQKDGKMAEAAALKASRPDAYLIAQVNLAERQIQKLKKEKSELVKAGAERAAVRALEEKITARMAAFNRAADALREKAGS